MGDPLRAGMSVPETKAASFGASGAVGQSRVIVVGVSGLDTAKVQVALDGARVESPANDAVTVQVPVAFWAKVSAKSPVPSVVTLSIRGVPVEPAGGV